MGVVTVEEMRSYLGAKEADKVGPGFSDADILEAMKFAAAEYNSIPPVNRMVNERALPGTTNMFRDWIAYFLLLARMNKFQRNQVQYDVSGTPVNLEKPQIEYMSKIIPLYEERARRAAVAHKTACNLRRYWGTVNAVRY